MSWREMYGMMIFCEKYGDNVVSNTFLSNGCLFNLFDSDLGWRDGDDGKVMGLSSYCLDEGYQGYELYLSFPEEDPRWWRKIEWFREMNGVLTTTQELHDNSVKRIGIHLGENLGLNLILI